MRTYNEISKKGQEEIKEQAIETLKHYEGYACDLHNEAFNMEYFIVGTWRAEEWLKKNIGVLNAIRIIQEYEQDQFGEVTTDLSDAERIVNMLVYIAGEELLSESETLQDNWNKQIGREECAKIAEELRAQ